MPVGDCNHRALAAAENWSQVQGWVCCPVIWMCVGFLPRGVPNQQVCGDNCSGPPVTISGAEYHGAASLKLVGGTAELHSHWAAPAALLHTCHGVTMPTMSVCARLGQNALLKSCEKYFHQGHSARAFPGSQHCVSRAQQAEEKR